MFSDELREQWADAPKAKGIRFPANPDVPNAYGVTRNQYEAFAVGDGQRIAALEADLAAVCAERDAAVEELRKTRAAILKIWRSGQGKKGGK